MHLPPLSRPYFSPDRGRERVWLLICWLITAAAALILIFAWPQTRRLDFILYLHQWSDIALVEYLFRAISFLGEDIFFMLLFGLLLWCVDKNLGFWTAVMLFTSSIYRGVIKGLTMLERPAVEGVVHPPDSAFPSGHTLTAITLWGYLAVRIKKTGFWVWAIIVMASMGLSRMVLGHHFLGDVLGGVALGLPFLLFFLWLSVQFMERGWVEKFSMPLLLALSIIVPVVLAVLLPGADSPKLLGCLAGVSAGYIIEKAKVRSKTATALPLQFIKVALGFVVLFGIIEGLKLVLPSAGDEINLVVKMAGFGRYFLGGIWGTLLAPALFVALKLTPREPAD